MSLRLRRSVRIAEDQAQLDDLLGRRIVGVDARWHWRNLEMVEFRFEDGTTFRMGLGS